MNTIVVIPTYNESENVAELKRRLPKGVDVLVVDDSPDNKTTEAAEAAGFQVLHRAGKKGLSSAVIDGLRICDSDKIIVMDADLQHPPELIPKIIEELDGNDFVVASRYIKGGGCEEWDLDRKVISRVANLAARPLTNVKDAVSGFFGFRRGGLPDLDTLSTRGFKIMLELLVRGNWNSIVEIPFTFGIRTRGRTKLGWEHVRDYLLQLASLYLCKFRWLKFGMIGAIGATIHLTLLYVLTERLALWYILSAILSIVVASTFNYVLNHKWTFRERIISNHAVGWAKYQVLSAITDAMYLGLLALTVEVVGLWYMAGALFSMLIVFPVKYVVASTLIWKAAPRGDIDAASYDWHSFYRGHILQKWWKRSIAKTIWEWIPNSSNLLNAGCGSSPIAVQYPTSTCIDINQGKLDFLKERLPNIIAEQMDLNNLTLLSESFDYVLCTEVLEHLVEPEKAISEIARVLKPGGRALIATPDYNRPLWLLAEKFTLYKEQHVSKFTRKSLEEMCKNFGLVPIRHKYIAGCDLVELFGKSHDDEHYPESKLALVSAGIEVVKRMARPSISRANFAITYKCNQQCKTCNIWRTYRNEPERVGDEVTLEEFNKILENNSLIWLSLTGGEPFLRDDIGEMLEACTNKLKITSIVTNGSKPEFIEEAVRHSLMNSEGILTLNVSLEGEQTVHNNFAGSKDSWERATETLRRLSLIKCDRLKLGIEYLLSTKLDGQTEYIREMAQSLGAGITYAIEQAAPFYDNRNSEVSAPVPPKVKLQMNPLGVASHLFVKGVGNHKKVRCVAGEYSCFIDPYCVVHPCLFYTPTHPLVDLRETEYRIGKLDCEQLVKECKGCWTPCETYATMIFRPWRLL